MRLCPCAFGGRLWWAPLAMRLWWAPLAMRLWWAPLVGAFGERLWPCAFGGCYFYRAMRSGRIMIQTIILWLSKTSIEDHGEHRKSRTGGHALAIKYTRSAPLLDPFSQPLPPIRGGSRGSSPDGVIALQSSDAITPTKEQWAPLPMRLWWCAFGGTLWDRTRLW